MKKLILCLVIFNYYKINAQTLMFDYLNKSTNKKIEKYSIPYSLMRDGKENIILDSFDVKYYSRLLFHLQETEWYSHYQNFDMIRLIITPSFQESMLVKIIHIENYDSLLIIVKTFDFSNHIMKDMIGEELNAPIDKKSKYIYKYKLMVKKISVTNWGKLIQQTNSVNKWYSVEPKNIPVPDGTDVMLEEHFKTGYFFIHHDYDDRENNELKKTIHYILKLL